MLFFQTRLCLAAFVNRYFLFIEFVLYLVLWAHGKSNLQTWKLTELGLYAPYTFKSKKKKGFVSENLD